MGKRKLKVVGHPQRSCGECSACCSEIEIKEGIDIDHAQGCACKHLTGSDGCGIYKERPQLCRQWSCAWLTGFGEEDDRPDRSGVIVYLSNSGVNLRAFGQTCIEQWKRVFRFFPLLRWIEDDGSVTVLINGRQLDKAMGNDAVAAAFAQSLASSLTLLWSREFGGRWLSYAKRLPEMPAYKPKDERYLSAAIGAFMSGKIRALDPESNRDSH